MPNRAPPRVISNDGPPALKASNKSTQHAVLSIPLSKPTTTSRSASVLSLPPISSRMIHRRFFCHSGPLHTVRASVYRNFFLPFDFFFFLSDLSCYRIATTSHLTLSPSVGRHHSCNLTLLSFFIRKHVSNVQSCDHRRDNLTANNKVVQKVSNWTRGFRPENQIAPMSSSKFNDGPLLPSFQPISGPHPEKMRIQAFSSGILLIVNHFESLRVISAYRIEIQIARQDQTIFLSCISPT